MNRRIIRNQVKCKRCGDIIESRSTHEYVTCSCGAVGVDGGHEYLKRTFVDEDCYEELSLFEDNSQG